MLVNPHDVKSRLIACCDDLETIVKENAVEYGESVLRNLVELKKSIRSHVFKIYLVGPFSCGKSSLLNRWLGTNILSTGLTPETAVSSEIRFGEHERMLLQPLGESKTVEEMSEVNEANMIRIRDLANRQKVANVILYLNNPRLKEHSDICLVDLPGLSSANLAHEAALTRFIQGTERVAIFCVPMTDGTIQGDAFEFLKKLALYGVAPTVLLTKADEKPDSDHAAIMNMVRKHLKEYGWNDVFVGKVSKDSIDDFDRLIQYFDKEKDNFLLQWFGEKIKNLAEDIAASLRRSLAIQFDDSKIEDALAKIKATEEDLPTLVREINREMTMSARNAVSDVLEKVRTSIMDQQGNLLSKAESGVDCAAEISSIIRSTLADEAPLAIEDTVSAAENRAGELLDERMDFDFSTNKDVIEPEIVPQGQFVTSSPSKQENSVGKSFETGMQVGETAFLLGELFLPGPGGLIGVALASVAMFFMGAKNSTEEQSRRRAEFTMKLEDACKSTRPCIERTMMGAVETCSKKLQLAVEGKVKELHEQMNQLKRESDAGKAKWESQQFIRRSTLDRIDAVLREAGIQEG